MGALMACSAKANNLVINGSPIHSQHHSARMLLEQAYRDIGIQLSYTELPYVRSAVNANIGVIDGLDVRLASHTDAYDNLVKIDVPLLLSRTLVVVNRKLCPDCDIKGLRSVGVVSGYSFPRSELNLADIKNTVVELPEHHRLFTFFKGGRVNGIVTSELYLPNELRDNRLYRYIEIGRQPVFHYLHKNHSAMAKQLEKSLRALTREGINQGKFADELLLKEIHQTKPLGSAQEPKKGSSLVGF